MSSLVVFATWTFIYRRNLNYPPQVIDIPQFWINRSEKYSHIYSKSLLSFETQLKKDPYESTNSTEDDDEIEVKQFENERIYPSKFGNFISSQQNNNNITTKLVCYYGVPNDLNNTSYLLPSNIDPHLCTHLNIGVVEVSNCTLYIDDEMTEYLKQSSVLKKTNKDLKILLWVGGGGSVGFSEMVLNHANRKKFIQSLKKVLETYRLDGIDIDWEFPDEREKIHFSQLLHEIRREYQREHRTYLLSVAVAAPELLVDVSYNVREINNYADYVNIMTYDYHFFDDGRDMTGLNAPLYARHSEGGVLSRFNIDYSANFWISRGLEKSKIIIGLPTYGHTFK